MHDKDLTSKVTMILDSSEKFMEKRQLIYVWASLNSRFVIEYIERLGNIIKLSITK